jgi:hypothetical protein
MMHLIERIARAIETNEDDSGQQSANIAVEYRRATTQEQYLLDRVFIALCGYSLKTLIEGRPAPMVHIAAAYDTLLGVPSRTPQDASL